MAVKACFHLEQIQAVTPRSDGCEECLKTGDEWVELRVCMTCGHVGCCNSSKNKHATKHFHETGHPIIRNYPDHGAMSTRCTWTGGSVTVRSPDRIGATSNPPSVHTRESGYPDLSTVGFSAFAE